MAKFIEEKERKNGGGGKFSFIWEPNTRGIQFFVGRSESVR